MVTKGNQSRERAALAHALCGTWTLDFPVRIINFSVIFKLILEQLISGGGNRSIRRKPPPNHNSLESFSHATSRIRATVVVRDS